MTRFSMIVAATALAAASTCNAKEGLSAPAYPLYTIARHYAPDTATTSADLELLARSFKFVQGLFTKEQSQFMHSVNSDLKIIPYMNTAYVMSDDDLKFIEQHRDQCLYYLAAALRDGVGPAETRFQLEPFGKAPIALVASSIKGDVSSTADKKPSTKYFVTWIRVGDELMRIDAWDKKTGAITVARGFSGSKPAARKVGDNVFCPLYSHSARPGGNGGRLNYHFDPQKSYRWNLTVAETLDGCRKNGYDGAWLDLLSESPFRATNADGAPSKPWNFAANHLYTDDEYREANERGISEIQNRLHKQLGRWPFIVANNFQASGYAVGEGGLKLFLKPTAIKPRPLDGFCIESFSGSNEVNTDYHGWLKGGPPIAPRILSQPKWAQRVAQLMRAAQEGICACPMNMNAGQKVEMYEHCSLKEVDDFESFAYASYLLGVEKKGANCPTVFGTPSFHCDKDGVRRARLHPRYTWPIGDPAQTVAPDQFGKYLIAGHKTYARRFTNGIVLVNPDRAEDKSVDLGATYVDPETGKPVRTVDLPRDSSKILLKGMPR